ncbi:MAG TPA: hypothetical protein VK772_02865 [Puia sp.]|nr:hypothetical protein [Puia sp.]
MIFKNNFPDFDGMTAAIFLESLSLITLGISFFCLLVGADANV